MVNVNPTDGSFATTTDQTCQTANDSSKAGIDIQRFRRAIARPVVTQNVLSSGRQSASTSAHGRRCSGLVDALHLGKFGQALQRIADHTSPPCAGSRSASSNEPLTRSEQQHEAAGPNAGQIVQRAECNRQNEPTESADHADQSADRADVVRVVDRDVLVDGGLAEAMKKPSTNTSHGERDQSHFEMELNRAVRMPCTM